MQFLNWLQTNGFSEWVLTTTWVYPWVIALHSIGMGFLVGVIYMIGIRVLGFDSVPIRPLARFLLVVNIALIVNVLSGLTMFVIDAEHFFFSPTFRVKMLAIAVGLAAAAVLTARVFGRNAVWDGEGSAPPSVKIVAGIAVLSWTTAIVAGRLTAYLP